MPIQAPVLAGATSTAPLTGPVFISDLHLSSERPLTGKRFFRFMREDAPRYRELIILGDLFEFWIGDDAGAGAEGVVAALANATKLGQRVLLMHGNRDPLIGPAFCAATGATLLSDPIVVDVVGVPTLLTHGDAWCTEDVAYQKFRALVRDPSFQSEFLGKPLTERIAFARSARMQSEGEKATKAESIMDVTDVAVERGLETAGVRRVIHGHTHRPAAHELVVDEKRAERWVLPDWEFDDSGEIRGGYLDFVDGRPRLVFFDD